MVQTYLPLLSHSEDVAEDTVELLLCGRLEKVFQQAEERRLNRLFLVRQRAAIFLHTVKIQGHLCLSCLYKDKDNCDRQNRMNDRSVTCSRCEWYPEHTGHHTSSSFAAWLC